MSKYYCSVLNSEFNVGFEQPKSDTCNKRDKTDMEIHTLNKDSDAAKIIQLETDKIVHTTHAKAAQNILKSYKTNNDISLAALCFDLQQAQCTLKLSTGVQFYKKKLWTFNLGIHNIKTGKASMFV